VHTLQKLLQPFLVSLCSLLFLSAFPQSKNESFYVYRADWSAAPSLDSCTYFMHEIKKSDSEFICRYYNKFGPMIKQESYKDADLTIPNGRFCWYNSKGKIDSCGLVKNFHKDGHWEYFMGDSMSFTYYDEYDNGKFIKRAGAIKKDTAESSDSLSVTIVQIEAQFNNGSKGWVKYLERNLENPPRFNSIFSPGRYTVTISFLVNKQGRTEDIYLKKSVEWSADKEVMDIIEKSPAWKPATVNGKPVYYRQTENISFGIE